MEADIYDYVIKSCEWGEVSTLLDLFCYVLFKCLFVCLFVCLSRACISWNVYVRMLVGWTD